RTSPRAPGCTASVERAPTTGSPGAASAAEQRQGGVVKRAVGGEGAAGVDGGHAGKIGEPPPRFLDDDLAGGEVPGLEVGLHVDLGLAFGHQRVPEVVAEAALAIGGVDQAHEA